MSKNLRTIPNSNSYFARCLNVFVAAVMATSIYASSLSETSAQKPQPNEPRLELPVAAAVVQHAIAKYLKSGSGPKLDTAELTFKVTSGASAGAGFTFWIFTVGATITGTEVQQVGFTYKVPKAPASPSPVASPSATTPSAGTTGAAFSALNPEFRGGSREVRPDEYRLFGSG